MKKGRSRRSLVLSRSGPQDQFNAGVVALLQACAESIIRDTARGSKAEFSAGNLPHLRDMEIFIDDPPTKTLSLAQKYRTRCVRDDGYVDSKTFMLKKRPQSAFSQREYPKPWLVGADVGDDDDQEALPRTSPENSTDSPRDSSRMSRPRTAPARVRDGGRRALNNKKIQRPRSTSRQRPDDPMTLRIDSARFYLIDETWPTLHQLCAQGNPTMVRHTVGNSEQAEAQNSDSHGMTPLIVAAGLGHLQVSSRNSSRRSFCLLPVNFA